MQKRWVKVWSAHSGIWLPSILLLSATFLIGGFIGCLLASWVGRGGGEELAEYIRSYLLTVREGGGSSPSVPTMVWDVFRYPLMVAVLGFTALGLIGIPAVFAVRGFFLSFAISSFVRILGGAGLLLAAVVFGIPGMISIPVLFVLGTQGWMASRSIAERVSHNGRYTSPYNRAYWARCGGCMVGLFLCVWVERFVTAGLLAALVGSL